jgi:hypothetical protein
MSQNNAEAARVFGLLEAEWDSASKREAGGTTETFTKHLLEYRKQLGLSKADVAAKLGVQWTTVDRWEAVENGSLPRKSAVEKLRSLLNLHAEPPRQHSADPSDESHLGYRTLEYVTALQRHASKVWIGKARHRFQAVENLTVRKLVLENMKAGTHYTYVFPCRTEAAKSFEKFRDYIKDTLNQGELIGNQLTSLEIDHAVSEAEAKRKAEDQSAAFGFDSWYQSWIAMEYTDAAAKRFRRKRDIFIEIPVRCYQLKFSAVENKEQEEWDDLEDSKTAVITLELTEADAEHCWHLWQKHFNVSNLNET